MGHVSSIQQIVVGPIFGHSMHACLACMFSPTFSCSFRMRNIREVKKVKHALGDQKRGPLFLFCYIGDLNSLKKREFLLLVPES